MDFSQFLLNESYILSPYKICVANFICAYLETQFHNVDSFSSSSLDINAHGRLTYKLIMSMDCSFEELLLRINHNSSILLISSEVINIFNKEINRLRRFDIKHFHDFFDKIRLLVQKKFLRNRMKSLDDLESDQPLSTGFSYNQIHKMSLIGIFLRKLIIYYERLSYCETSTLFDQLQDYLKVSEPIMKNTNEKDLSENKQNNHQEKDNSEDLKSQIDSKILDEIESKLNLSSESFPNQIFRQHLLELIQKARFKLILNIDQSNRLNKRKLSDENLDEDPKSELMDETEYSMRPLESNSASSSAMDLDVTINDNNDMSLDRTVFDHRANKQSESEEIDNTSNMNEITIPKIEKNFSKLTGLNHLYNIYDTSQHYLVKQIYKIQYNEKLALTPQQLMRYIRSKFAQHNSFYYFRFITFNYLANLNLIRDQTGTQQNFSIPNSGSIPIVTVSDNRNNINQMGSQGPNLDINNGLIPGIPSSSSVAIDSLNKKYKSLFRSINFFNDIEYLKFINALRVNNYTSARKAFFDYFDLKKPSFEQDSMIDYGHSFFSGGNSSMMPMMMNGTTNNNNVTNLPGRADGHPGGIPGGAGTTGHHHPQDRNRSGDPSGRGSDFSGRSGILLNSNSTNYCWSALNLVMMYAHFRYYRLAYDALVDCLSLAREKRDERCLQYAMLWILQISQHLDHSKTTKHPKDYVNDNQKVYADLDLMENIIGLILTNQLTLPYISAKAFLHFYRLNYLKPGMLVSEQLSLSDVLDISYGNRSAQRRSPLLPQSFYVSIKYRLYDVLGETFSTFSAILNAYGATHLAAMYAKLWLRMDVIETIMEERIFRLDENTPIAIRNLAHYLWFVRGDHRQAYQLIIRFRNYFSSYNQRSQKILERATTEMMFERYVNIGEWNAATRCLNIIRCLDRTRSYLMLAELRRRQNEPLAALECLDLIMAKHSKGTKSQSSISKLSGTTFFRQNLFQSFDRNSDDDNDNSHEDSVVVRKVEKEKEETPTFPNAFNIMHKIRNLNFQERIQPINNLSFYERIQPPPPEELEPESERPLIPELDPYTWVECRLMRGMILEDLSILFECVSQSLSHGFKQLECRALVQIARIQSEVYGQHHNASHIIESVMHRILSQASLRDLAIALYVHASILFRMNRKDSEKSKLENETNYLFKPIIDQPSLKPALILVKRSIVIWEFIQDRNGLYESLKLASFIENEQNNFPERNFYAKRARMIRTIRM